jgi:hypothetical protein
MTAERVGGHSPESPTIPTWVPEPVAQAAHTLRAHYLKSKNVKFNAVLERLIADGRMGRVWKELSKHRREQHEPTDAFFHSSRLASIDSQAAQDHQHAAMASLFNFAINLAVDAPGVIARNELQRVRNRMLDKVEALRLAADELRRYGQAAAAKVNEDIARSHEEQLPKMVASPLVVDRDTGDAKARGFCILFTGYCRQLFGSPLWGITAIVASVALGREISARAVREWCDSHPCG